MQQVWARVLAALNLLLPSHETGPKACPGPEQPRSLGEMRSHAVPYIDQPLHRTDGEGGVQGNPGTCPSSFQQEETADGVRFRLESEYPDPRGSKNKERKEKCTELRWKTWGKEKRTKCDQYRGGSSRSSRGERTLTQGRRRGGGSEAVDDGGEGKNESDGESLRGKERASERCRAGQGREPGTGLQT